MSRFTVLITDHPWPNLELERELLGPIDAEWIDAPDDDEATLVELARDVDVISTCWGEVTDKVIEAAPNCRLVARFGIGLDNIDVQCATSRGIPVTNVPDYCISEVADHTLGLMLALTRNIVAFDRLAKQQRYDLQACPTMFRLEGRTLGLIGFGRTAQAVRDRALAFGLRVIANSPTGNDRGTGCEMVPFEKLLAESDLISIHAPLNDSTEHLFDEAAFAAVKPGAILINTARGPIVDPDALWNAIQAGQIAGAGLDVFEPEPPDLSEPLYQDERVIVTPHAAFTSEESLIELRTRVCEQITQILQNEIPANVVNPGYRD